MIDTRFGIAGLAVAIGVLVVAPASAQVSPSSGDPEAPSSAGAADFDPDVRETVERFREALAAGDSLAVVELLHPEVRVYEGGHAETLDEYRSGHLAADIEFQGAVSGETLDEALVATDAMALYTREYRMRGTLRDREIDAHGTETLVLVPTDEGWRIRHIHWSSR